MLGPTTVARAQPHRVGRCKIVSNSIWYRTLVFFGSAIILAIREKIVRAINDEAVGRVGDRITDYATDIFTMLFISAVLVIGIMVISVEIVLVIFWFLLFLLDKLL
jgi:hypothetical protein